VPTAPPGGDRHPSPSRGAGSRTKLLVAAVVAALVAVTGGIAAAAIVGNGGGGGGGGDDPTSDPTAESSFLTLGAEEILLTSEKEMKVLDTVLVTSQFADGKKNVSIRMSITSSGDCSGTMSYLGSGTAQVLRKDGRIMIRPDARFLADFGIDNAQTFLQYLDGRWLEFTDDPEQFASVCDLDEFLERDGREEATATTVGTSSVKGQEAVKVRLQEGTQAETYFVMVAEPHYLLRLDETKRAWFEYSEFNEPVDIELPPSSEILKDSDIQ
jgi:hypothetical protein